MYLFVIHQYLPQTASLQDTQTCFSVHVLTPSAAETQLRKLFCTFPSATFPFSFFILASSLHISVFLADLIGGIVLLGRFSLQQRRRKT